MSQVSTGSEVGLIQLNWKIVQVNVLVLKLYLLHPWKSKEGNGKFILEINYKEQI